MKRYTQQEDEMLRKMADDYTLSEIGEALGRSFGSVNSRMKTIGIRRDPAKLEARKRVAPKNWQKTAFKPGHETWNKGRRGLRIGGEATMFKPGHQPWNVKEIGHERVGVDGYIYIKVREESPQFVLKHRWIYEQANGAVPPDHVIVFNDGNTQNCELSNLTVLSRKELMQRNSIHRYPDELKAVIRIKNKIDKTIKNQENEQD